MSAKVLLPICLNSAQDSGTRRAPHCARRWGNRVYRVLVVNLLTTY